ncbi:VanZ family protein [Streptomyces sp. NBC_00873]|uniref:VanZ family protein n=1 Tax=Streptomyces sp. NBC_00873 TaxID=2975852 RepID=UPI003865D600|nr:VanZ family protein [Streptomyces sp. NBC_00873]
MIGAERLGPVHDEEDNVNRALGIADIVGNVAMFVPVGWLLRVVLPRAGAVVAAGAGLSLLIGLGQLLLSRAADVNDVMLTSCGWVLGAGLTRFRTRAS